MKPPVGRVIFFCGAGRVGWVEAADCVSWAEQALAAGLDSRSLRILAGLMPPYCSPEVREYGIRALSELGIELPSGTAAVSAYARDLIEEIVQIPESLEPNLFSLYALCLAEDFQKDLYDFYLLHCAYTELKVGDSQLQFYWEGACGSNIEQVVRERCETWLERYER